MFKKMLPWIIMLLVVITLIVAAAFLLWNNLFSDSGADPNAEAKAAVEGVESEEMPADEVKELSVEINDILTNLMTGDIIKISFTFELSNEKVKEEFTLLDFKIKATINQVLADMTPEQTQGSQGLDLISSTLLNKINPILQEGKVRRVNVTAKIVQ